MGASEFLTESNILRTFCTVFCLLAELFQKAPTLLMSTITNDHNEIQNHHNLHCEELAGETKIQTQTQT